MIGLWLALACAAPSVRVTEALDVPPPPGKRSVDLGPGNLAGVPGDTRSFDGHPAEIVDRRAVGDGVVLTVYVDEDVAERWLDVGAVRAR